MRLYSFSAISQKIIDGGSLEYYLKKKMIEVMCFLEAYFPWTFFDISIHLIVHLVKEPMYLGLMFLHHMYLHKRFMNILNRYAKSHVHPKGSMAQCYSTKEVIGWCLSYIDPTNPIGISKPWHEGRLGVEAMLGRSALL